jgi:glucosamine-6-phosphate deaminase
LLRGDAPDLAAECRACDAVLAQAGGLDLAILGLGANGHIAFNEPGSPWDAPTWVAELTPETRAATGAERAAMLPDRGITLGIAALKAARRVLLLVAGPAKRRALAALRAGVATPRWPVTSLLGHPGLTVLVSPELAGAPTAEIDNPPQASTVHG